MIDKIHNNMKISHKYYNGISVFLNRYTPKKYKSGFTLIELMVVISIIGLLSSVVLASLKDAKDKAMITKTLVEMKSLETALEMYRNQFGKYPGEELNYNHDDDDDCITICGLLHIDNSSNMNTFLQTELVNRKFITKVPHAPNYPNNCKDDCGTNGYVLGYATYDRLFNASSFSKITDPESTKLYCGDKKIENYVIYFFTNSKKINLPEMRYVNSEESNLLSTLILVQEGNIYCLSM